MHWLIYYGIIIIYTKVKKKKMNFSISILLTIYLTFSVFGIEAVDELWSEFDNDELDEMS